LTLESTEIASPSSMHLSYEINEATSDGDYQIVTIVYKAQYAT